MYYFDVFRVLGKILFGFLGIFFIPLIVTLYLEYPKIYSVISFSFLETFAIIFILACASYSLGRKAMGILYKKEYWFLLVITACLIPLLSALPFWFSGTLSNPYHAFFESVSALSTTGATTIQNPQLIDASLLFWRSYMQWVGGYYFILLCISIWPALGMMESSIESGKDSIGLELHGDMLRLFFIYSGLTLLQVILLHRTNVDLSWLESINVAFSTISTGGMTVHADNIAHYNNGYTEWIITIFMFLGGMNLFLFFFLMRGSFYKIYNFEFLAYCGLLILGILSVAWLLVGTENHLLNGETKLFQWQEAMHYSTFQVVSAQSTTGFAIANYASWPAPVQVLLTLLAWIGGMFGSAAGGIKILRMMIFFEVIRIVVERLFRPQKVPQGQRTDNWIKATSICVAFLMLFIGILGTAIYVVDGIDMISAFSIASCMITTSGMGFGAIAPPATYAQFSDFVLFFSSCLMLLSRLEFLAFIALLFPSFWRRSY